MKTSRKWSESEDGQKHYLHENGELIACITKLDHCWMAKGRVDNDPLGAVVSLGKHVNLEDAIAECEAPWPEGAVWA